MVLPLSLQPRPARPCLCGCLRGRAATGRAPVLDSSRSCAYQKQPASATKGRHENRAGRSAGRFRVASSRLRPAPTAERSWGPPRRSPGPAISSRGGERGGDALGAKFARRGYGARDGADSSAVLTARVEPASMTPAGRAYAGARPSTERCRCDEPPLKRSVQRGCRRRPRRNGNRRNSCARADRAAMTISDSVSSVLRPTCSAVAHFCEQYNHD